MSKRLLSILLGAALSLGMTQCRRSFDLSAQLHFEIAWYPLQQCTVLANGMKARKDYLGVDFLGMTFGGVEMSDGSGSAFILGRCVVILPFNRPLSLSIITFTPMLLLTLLLIGTRRATSK